MDIVKFSNPEGIEVQVPASDAPQFDAMGWPRTDGSKATSEAEDGSAYDAMTVAQLRDAIEARGIETTATKKAELIAALIEADANA